MSETYLLTPLIVIPGIDLDTGAVHDRSALRIDNAAAFVVRRLLLTPTKAGDAGTIWALYDMKPPMYEITFQASDGQDFDLTLSEEEITEVVHDRRLSRQL